MDKKTRCLVSVITFILGVILLLYGAHRGEVNTVFSKSIRICLECIGIG